MSFRADPNSVLSALVGVTPAADKLPYFTSGSAAAVVTLSSWARDNLLGVADAGAARTALSAQASAAVLAAIATAGNVGADGEILVGTGAGAFAWESGATARTSLGLAIGTDVQAFGAVLDDLNTLGASGADGEFLVATGAGTLAWESGATARTSLGLGTGDNVTFANVTVAGDLIVQGDKLLAQLETVLVNDNFIELNSGYTSDAGQAAGLIFRYDPTATKQNAHADGFVAAVVSTADAYVTVADASGFGVGDIIAIDGSGSNDGMAEVASTDVVSTPNRVYIAGEVTANQDTWGQTDFTTEAGAGTITKVNIGVVRFSSAGVLEAALGSTVPLSYGAVPFGPDSVGSSELDLTDDYSFSGSITTDARNLAFTATSGAYNVLAADDVVIFDTSAGAGTANLPAATGTGRRLVIKNEAGGSNAVSVDPNAAELVDGGATASVPVGDSLTVIDYAAGKWAIL